MAPPSAQVITVASNFFSKGFPESKVIFTEEAGTYQSNTSYFLWLALR